MNTLRIEIRNPKAMRLLKELAERNLIAIKEPSKDSFMAALKKLRSKRAASPSLEEITKEVEIVRSKRYAR